MLFLVGNGPQPNLSEAPKRVTSATMMPVVEEDKRGSTTQGLTIICKVLIAPVRGSSAAFLPIINS